MLRSRVFRSCRIWHNWLKSQQKKILMLYDPTPLIPNSDDKIFRLPRNHKTQGLIIICELDGPGFSTTSKGDKIIHAVDVCSSEKISNPITSVAQKVLLFRTIAWWHRLLR
ncbi:hypothetical protein GWI33_020793 [Rhynchophorus ferrugineus]|uniref:Uncharacterized protein n=1 Tax=Rhynchophorus ferrugineus TaxID=354439 RepID=A0A834M3R9_RHYFE|nr:hypothetical protein GWI33_020793 [Rhynchophorus ferrugineus]